MPSINTQFGMVELSMSELRELLGASNAGSVERVTEIVEEQPKRKAPSNNKPPKAEPKSDSGNSGDTETLHCANGDHDYQRPRQRGRKPTSCEQHRDNGNSDSGSEDGAEDDSQQQQGKGKRQYQRKGNSENFVPRNALIDPATEDDLASVKAEIEAAGGKFEFLRIGLKNLDGGKCDFKIVYSQKKSAFYYCINDGDTWALYGSDDEYLNNLGVKRVNQKAKLPAEAVLWQKNGKSRIYVNPKDKNVQGGGWYVVPRNS